MNDIAEPAFVQIDAAPMEEPPAPAPEPEPEAETAKPAAKPRRGRSKATLAAVPAEPVFALVESRAEAAPEPLVTAPAEPDPAEISSPPAEPKRGWWRR